ncbi:prenyl cysteine carboxyl methyltransferase, putative [Entamoeba histolytica HM-1:IMSS-B]|uniref:Protein-S-isoprenylcysteine O-methyltransferase n=6 Tax=Entamoeba histolytica TaxID=5759 RepID=C4LTC8_ENTH1|nr:prenyl cysteine carboxyl methyltransferase, putative [Entamoeba histolytica HM-1:IMSS]EMD45955.1 prenyl cysteine carboxyl methyltransferase, putative [Entamoeba histolytica KU27]EMH76584.1 prenyl cysteine carboxyl methyltransferase, putative [Entamoeba histolytica HM-1:IMSS-B]EMS12407.1 prenyl cysteine carboxyl methyltransferase [Entamoeba histolytica HM-3:IMSS]ENY62883.1 prenyl cysteine carboxyl methyltransferase, putative [Entamoeba histolytica HM-1:IMSS-A]GAT91812.1 prenyl cysteine carbo|eukprot:XP_657326.2 prenyl cysteine carboxyl methyltransferase, putative [Entamoeba histolytica HM-1:IMSS]
MKNWTQRIDLLVLTGVFVGLTFGFNFVLIFFGDTSIHLFMCLLFLYHFFEFTSSVYPRPYQSSLHDFMLFHSPPFMCAFALSIIEYYVEKWYFPSIKNHIYISIGFTFVALFFQSFRTIAMYVAGSNFNHYIETSHRQDHVLVTNGIYHYLRHPSYFGWFWWSVTTQIVMLNPLSTILYSIAAWYFFYKRIPYEEKYLIKLFGDDYLQYKQRTIVGIPFIH